MRSEFFVGAMAALSAALASLFFAATSDPASAQARPAEEIFGPFPATTEPAPRATQIWSGGEIRDDSWAVYVGGTYALNGDITQPGWRLRAVAGYSPFDYKHEVFSLVDIAGQLWGTKFSVTDETDTATFANAFAGYQFQFGPTTLKALGGAVFKEVSAIPSVRNANAILKREYKLNTVSTWGVGGALETWTNLPYNFALKADLSVHHYFDGDVDHSAAKLNLLVGRRFGDRWFLGFEGSMARELDYISRRLSNGFDLYSPLCPSTLKHLCGEPKHLTSYTAGVFGSYRIGRTLALSASAGYATTETHGDGTYGRLQVSYDF